MIPALQPAPEAAMGVGVASTAGDLSAIHDPRCAAVIWRRNFPAEVDAVLAAMTSDSLPSARIILRPDAVAQVMAILCDGIEAGNEDAFEWLKQDVATLARHFTDLLHPPYLRLRLEVVRSDACRRFHVDAVTARLICTYRGTGTQYGISADGGEPERIFTVPTGAPVIVRGTRWPAEPPSGLLHRSPPIAGTGETRLLLVLDPIFDPDDEPDHVVH